MARIQIIKKNHFIFNENNFSLKNKAIFTFNESYSNIFITLLDLNKRVICTKSAGMANLGNSKKKKLSTQTIDILVKQLLIYLRLYKIEEVSIIIKAALDKFFFTFVHKLNYFGISISNFILYKKIPHNGMRSRKLRKV